MAGFVARSYEFAQGVQHGFEPSHFGSSLMFSGSATLLLAGAYGVFQSKKSKDKITHRINEEIENHDMAAKSSGCQHMVYRRGASRLVPIRYQKIT